jgi:Glucose dehydrogenase
MACSPRNPSRNSIHEQNRQDRRAIVGILLTLLGLGLAAGGGYLIALGGSWFYLPAGLAMAGVGLGLLLRKGWALWLAWALLIASAIWAFAEAAPISGSWCRARSPSWWWRWQPAGPPRSC